ncbi:MAG: hypothetical protein RBR43_09905 [Desulfuromonadaceae bacterium]|jgi:hypothetical protein|nr:hypothetical protein [Desulfuromonadaceae bacterium]
MALISRIITWIAGFLSTSGARDGARIIFIKAWSLFLFVTVIPYVLTVWVTRLGAYVFGLVDSQFTIQPFYMQFTGMLGWLLDAFQIPYCFTVIMSAYVARYTIKSLRLMVLR